MVIYMSKIAGCQDVESNLSKLTGPSPCLSWGLSSFCGSQTEVGFCFQQSLFWEWQKGAPWLLRLGVHLLLTFFTST